MTMSANEPRAKKLLEQALSHHRAGRRAEAASLYRKILAGDPKEDGALYALGLLELEAGRSTEAVELFRRAVEAAPDRPAYLCNLGVAYRRVDKHREAADAFVRACALKPDFAEASFNLALVLEDALGDAEAALVAYERAADLAPQSFSAQYRLARGLARKGELLRAVGHYHAALALDPKAQAALYELAQVLRKLGRRAAAIATVRRALEEKPDNVLALAELASMLVDDGRPDEALEPARRAVALDPKNVEPLFQLAAALEDSGRLGEALEAYRKALALEPDAYGTHDNVVFVMAFDPRADAKAIFDEAKRWDRTFAEPLASHAVPHANACEPGRRLRVGYVSPNFRDHCQSFFTVPLFTHHDRRAFEVVAYSCGDRADAVTERLRGLVDVWRDVSRAEHDELARQVREDGIDILVDLTMHMEHSRLLTFARRPAPVQICWLAYPGTTGLSAIDYRVTDRFLDPPGEAQGPYSERSIVLPDTFWCYDPLVTDLEPARAPALESGRVTFGCLNAFRKVNDATLSLWARVLEAVPNSRFVLLAPPGGPRARVLAAFERAGVEPSRVAFVDRRPRREYLRAYHGIDLCLDTFPYGGHTTSLDAFWMGVPVVSLVGPTVVGRAGVTLATQLSVPELTQATSEDFVRVASALGNDPPRLHELRAGLRARMQRSPLMDGARFAKNLERGYRRVWERWCAGLGAEDCVLLPDDAARA